MKNYICIDIGGSFLKLGVVNQQFRILHKETLPTRMTTQKGFAIPDLTNIIETLLQTYKISGICISTAGMVNTKTGEILYANENLPGYTGTPVKKLLEEHFSLPCSVENDVNCAALAEARLGAAKAAESCLCLTIGTGIGGAFVANGKVFHGASFSACEIGYMHMPGGIFQDMASAKALAENVRKRKALPADYPLDGRDIFCWAAAGDEDCLAAIDAMCDCLSMGIANLCYAFNPEIVILGGGIMARQNFLYEKLQTGICSYLLSAVWKNTRLAFAALQNDAGMLGALCSFLSEYEEM